MESIIELEKGLYGEENNVKKLFSYQNINDIFKIHPNKIWKWKQKAQITENDEESLFILATIYLHRAASLNVKPALRHFYELQQANEKDELIPLTLREMVVERFPRLKPKLTLYRCGNLLEETIERHPSKHHYMINEEGKFVHKQGDNIEEITLSKPKPDKAVVILNGYYFRKMLSRF